MFTRVSRYAVDACLQVSLRGNRGSELVQDVESCRSAGYVEIDVRFDQQRAPGLHPRRHTLIDTRAAALQTFRILPDLYECGLVESVLLGGRLAGLPNPCGEGEQRQEVFSLGHRLVCEGGDPAGTPFIRSEEHTS